MAGGLISRLGVMAADATRGAWFLPSGAASHYYRGVLYSSGKEYDKAIDAFNEAIRRNPALAVAYKDRGVAYQARRECGLALADAQRVLNFARTDRQLRKWAPLLHCNRGISFKLLGEFERALAEFGRALARDPRYADAYAERGALHQAEGRAERAMSDFNAALGLKPGHARALRSRGKWYFYVGDFPSAINDLRRSLSRKPEAYAALFLYLAQARAGQHAAAAARLRRHASLFRGAAWPRPIFDLLLGRASFDAAMLNSSTPGERGEAAFYIGQMHLLANDEHAARDCFQRTLAYCTPIYAEYTGARAELGRLALPAS